MMAYVQIRLKALVSAERGSMLVLVPMTHAQNLLDAAAIPLTEFAPMKLRGMTA
jgi:hypothetical protein